MAKRTIRITSHSPVGYDYQADLAAAIEMAKKEGNATKVKLNKVRTKTRGGRVRREYAFTLL